MSFKVTKLTVGKGRTSGNEKAGVWTKQYYELEITIEDEHDVEIAKASVEGLIDGWLTGQTHEKSPLAQHINVENWDPNKIEWKTAEGSKGPYERSEDVNNLEFKAMLKDLRVHNGKMTRGEFFYWAFEKSAVVGRKKRK